MWSCWRDLFECIIILSTSSLRTHAQVRGFSVESDLKCSSDNVFWTYLIFTTSMRTDWLTIQTAVLRYFCLIILKCAGLLLYGKYKLIIDFDSIAIFIRHLASAGLIICAVVMHHNTRDTNQLDGWFCWRIK